jgi:hypothetical protein
MNNMVLSKNPWIFAESPILDDAGFTSRWLQDAVLADRLLKDCYGDPDFLYAILQASPPLELEFASAAMSFVLSCAADGMMSFEVADYCYAASFAIMADVGFYYDVGDRYEMTLPEVLDVAVVKAAVLKLAATADLDNCASVHPEFLLATISKERAHECELTHPGASWWN